MCLEGGEDKQKKFNLYMPYWCEWMTSCAPNSVLVCLHSLVVQTTSQIHKYISIFSCIVKYINSFSVL